MINNKDDLSEYKFLYELVNINKITSEETIKIVYTPLSMYKIKPVTRQITSLNGHTDSVLCVAFSSNGLMLATGCGDTTVILWDLYTHLPLAKLKKHTSYT